MNLRGVFPTVLTLTILSAGSAAAAPLTWEDCVAAALEHHPDLAAAKAAVAQSEANKNITRGTLLPQIDGDLGGSSVSSRASAAADSSRSNSFSYGVSGSQLVFDGFATLLDLEQAAKAIDSGRFNYEVVSSDARLGLRVAFIGLLRAQDSLRLAEQIEKRRLQSRDLIQLRYDAGREHRGSLLTAEANLAQAVFESAQARRNILLAGRRLLTRMGLSGGRRYSGVWTRFLRMMQHRTSISWRGTRLF